MYKLKLTFSSESYFTKGRPYPGPILSCLWLMPLVSSYGIPQINPFRRPSGISLADSISGDSPLEVPSGFSDRKESDFVTLVAKQQEAITLAYCPKKRREGESIRGRDFMT